MPGILPRPLTSFIGRDADVMAALALLVDKGVRLLSLTGPGGVGKTRLALRIAEEATPLFPDGVVFVPLAPIVDHNLVLPTVARELGLRDIGVEPPAALIGEYLRDKRLLLVLDNFEQVCPAGTEIAALLATCPAVVALVTSRSQLHVGGEQRFPVAPLDLPASSGADDQGNIPPLEVVIASPAVRLFVARALAVDPHFAVDTANATAIAAICHRLDGLPLAIELAAARIHFLSPSALLSHLDASLSLLTGGPEDAPDRLRTMRQAIAWSYDMLSPEEQTLFRHLAIFVGGFTLESAEWLSVGSRDGDLVPAPHRLPVSHLPATPSPSSDVRHSAPNILDRVAALVDRSLLRRIDRADEAMRFAMLETIREFAFEQLVASGERDAIAARHAAWCIDLAETVRTSGRLSQRRGLVNLEVEHPNLRAALEWLLTDGAVTSALHLTGLLAEFWLRHGHWTEGKAWLERTLAADDGEPTAARAVALVGLAMMRWPWSDFAAAQHLLREAEAVARLAGDTGALAYARLHQGYVAAFQGDLDLAAARAEEVLETYEAIPQGFGLHGPLWLLARVALARRENERATGLYENLLVSAKTEGDEISLSNAHYAMAILAERRDEPHQALAEFIEAARVCHSYGDRFHACLCLDGVATAAVALGWQESGVRLFAAADALRAAVGAPVHGFVDDRQRNEQALAAVRKDLETERFAAAWAAGAALSLDEAIAEAASLALVNERAPDRCGDAMAGLTERERDVLRLLVTGRSDKEIAATLGIARRTVSNHVATIRDKLDAPSRTAAAAIAVREHLV